MDNKVIKREYNMDLERVLLIFMVIVLHFNNRGMGGALNYAAVGGGKEIFLRMSQSMCICAVDAFMILSGYFYVKKDTIPWKKAIWLLVTCSFYRVAGYLIYSLCITGDFSVRTLIAYVIPSNWFVGLFVTVLLLSPFIGKGITCLNRSAFRQLVLILTILFTIIPTITIVGGDIAGVDLTGLSTISINGDVEGFTIVSFVYCFIIGCFIRSEKEYLDDKPAFLYWVIYLISATLSCAISYKSEKVWSYSGIFTVICAVSLTIAFSKARISNDKVGRVLGNIGGCGLGIFVWHTMPLMIYGYWVHLNIDSISDGSMGHYLGTFLKATVSMYIISLVWVYVCRTLVTLVKLNRSKK